jgi:endonuclease YncB( thermonuclease family)
MPTGGEALVADGRIELNREMVREGWALAYYPEHGPVPRPA